MSASPLHLGDLMALGNRRSADLTSWLNGVDAALGARLERAAAERGETLAQFIRVAAADFLAQADEEAWAGLLSSARDAGDPGAACVAAMTAFRLRLERPA